MALEDKETPEDESPNPQIADLISTKLSDGKLSCAAAFVIAETLGVPPLDVGKTADLMDVRLSRCQLGFFGYPNKQAWDQADFDAMPVPEGLSAVIDEARDHAADISCAKLWELAAAYGVPRLQIGYLTDQLGIHVTPCQLGAF